LKAEGARTLTRVGAPSSFRLLTGGKTLRPRFRPGQRGKSLTVTEEIRGPGDFILKSLSRYRFRPRRPPAFEKIDRGLRAVRGAARRKSVVN